MMSKKPLPHTHTGVPVRPVSVLATGAAGNWELEVVNTRGPRLRMVQVNLNLFLVIFEDKFHPHMIK